MSLARISVTGVLLPSLISHPAQAAVPPESADARAVVLPLALEVDPPDAAGGLDDIFASAVQPGGVETLRAGTAGCDRVCIESLAAEYQASHVVRGRLRGSARDYQFEIDVVDNKGTVVATTGGACDTCGTSELHDFLRDQAVRVSNRLEALRTRPAVLRLQTDPPGAIVRLDGEVVGKSPLAYETVAGKKHLQVELRGHVAREREVELINGVEESIELTLEPKPETTRDRAGRFGPILGGVSLGAGLGLVGGGIASLLIDSEPVPYKCNDANTDADGDCKYLHDTRSLGIALTAGGAVLTGVGIGVLVWSLARGRRARTAGLRLSPTGVALTGRF